MKHADLKPGMRVRITGDNKGRPGGRIGGYIGNVYTLQSFKEVEKSRHIACENEEGEEVVGYWVMLGVDYVWHESQFEVIEEEAKVDKPLRDAKGRFVKKNAPVKKEEVKKEPPPKPTLEKLLRDALGGRMGLNVSTNGILHKDGTVRLNPADICAARFYVQRSEAVEAIVIIDKYYQGYDEDTKKLYLQFLTYLFNGSPWKDCFVTKDAEEAVRSCVKFNVDAIHSHVLSAQQVLRQFSEFETFREVLKKLISKGVSMKHSVFIACYFNPYMDEFSLRPDTGHSVVYQNGLVKEIKSTFKDGKLSTSLDYLAPFKKSVPYHKGICCAVAANTNNYEGGFVRYTEQVCGKDTVVRGWGAMVNKYSLEELLIITGAIFG